MSNLLAHYNGIDMSQRGWGFYPSKSDEWDWLKIVEGRVVAVGAEHPDFDKDFREIANIQQREDVWSYETIMGLIDHVELDGDIVELSDGDTEYRFWVEDIPKVINILHKVHEKYLENKENEHN